MILDRGILHDKEISVHNSCWIGFWAACSVVGCSPIHGNFTKCDQYKPLCLIHMLFHVFWSICVKYLFSWREYLCMPFFGHQRFCVEVLCVASFPLFFKKTMLLLFWKRLIIGLCSTHKNDNFCLRTVTILGKSIPCDRRYLKQFSLCTIPRIIKRKIFSCFFLGGFEQ